MHQLSHIWIDFRGIQDESMRRQGIDYFENSRRATYVQQQYAIRNPRGFEGYGEHSWGITASNGPGPATRRVRGARRRFFGYRARGVPWGPDDGTLAAWSVAASLPFAPEIVLPTLGCAERASRAAGLPDRESRSMSFEARTAERPVDRSPAALARGQGGNRVPGKPVKSGQCPRFRPSGRRHAA
jgi:hypothetical protein